MTPAEFRAAIDRVWGYGSQTKAAAHFEVAGRTVRGWVLGERAVPERVAAELARMAGIAPPPAGTSADVDADTPVRDDAAQDALEPHIARIGRDAVAVGWHPGEVLTALLNLAAAQMAEGAGIPVTIQALRGLIAELKERRDT